MSKSLPSLTLSIKLKAADSVSKVIIFKYLTLYSLKMCIRDSSITLQDATGTIDAKLWNATNEQVEKLVMGCVVQVKGDVIKYNEDRQMKIIKIVVASTEPQEQVKFLKSAPQTGEELVKEIYTFIERINNLKLNQLVKALSLIHIYSSMLSRKTTYMG